MIRVAQPSDAERIKEIMLATGIGPGTGISEDTFSATMTVENIITSMDQMRWLLWDGGLFVLIPIAATTFEVHIAVLDGYRGSEALRAVETAMNMVFTRTPCVLLVGRTPLANRPACAFATMAGFRKVRVSGPSQLASISFFDWLALRENPEYALSQCEEFGQSAKSAASRTLLDWITRAEVPRKAAHDEIRISAPPLDTGPASVLDAPRVNGTREWESLDSDEARDIQYHLEELFRGGASIEVLLDYAKERDVRLKVDRNRMSVLRGKV